MPGGDRTGPMGMGPMTGRAAGYCAGYSVPGFANAFGGRGFGAFGGGRGRRNQFYATGLAGWQRAGLGQRFGACAPPAAGLGVSAELERERLRQQAEFLGRSLEEIKQRLADLEAGQRAGAQES